jgi:hypothetical protein
MGLDPQAVEKRPAVHARHVEIEQDDARPEPLAKLATVVVDAPGARDIEALHFQEDGDRVAGVIVIIDDENLVLSGAGGHT